MDDGLVDVDGEDGGGGEHGGIGGGHGGGGKGTETNVGDNLGTEVLDQVGESGGGLVCDRTDLGDLLPTSADGDDAEDAGSDGDDGDTDGGEVGELLGVLDRLAGEDSLEDDLPGDTTEAHQEGAIDPDTPVGAALDGAEPLRGVEGDIVDLVVGPDEGDGDPHADDHDGKLDDIDVDDGVEATDEGVDGGKDGGDDDGDDDGDVEEEAEGGAEGGEGHGEPEDISEDGGNVEQGSHDGAILLLEGVEHGDVLTLTHLLDEEEAGEQEADGVAPGSLRPDETAVDDGLDGTVEVSGADPAGDHGDDTNDAGDATTSEDHFGGGLVLLLLSGPDGDEDDEDVEDDDDGETNPIEASGGGGGGFLGGLGEAKSEAESQGDKILEGHEGQISVNGKGRKI